MSREALKEMHVNFNEHHEMSHVAARQRRHIVITFVACGLINGHVIA